jgi:hypothetical protein
MSQGHTARPSKISPRVGDIAPEKQRTTKAATAAESRHMGRVAALGCCICRMIGHGPTPAVVHHIREGMGASQRAPNWLTVPLCEEHHVGPTGYHTLRSNAFERTYGVTELDLLADTLNLLYGGIK